MTTRTRRRDQHAFTGPLAILVDEGVGSASENALLFPLVTLRELLSDVEIGVGDAVEVAERDGTLVVTPIRRVRGGHNLRELVKRGRDLSLAEFGRMLTTYEGWGMRICLVPDDELAREPCSGN